MKKRIVFAVVDKKTGRALMYADKLKQIIKVGECAESATLMCLTWESYLRRHQA
jgi:hypothetical protein